MSQSNLIVDALLEAPQRTLSGEWLSKKLGISRTSVWKYIKSLQKEGYRFEIMKGRGYRLLETTQRPVEREIKRGLSTKRLGKEVFCYETVGSTNEVAKELARTGHAEGVLVIAEEQSRGRGRLHRMWESPKGGLYMSIILRPDTDPASLTGLTLLSGLALARAIKSLYKVEVSLKWPNDIYVKDKKVGGILSETEGEADKVNFVIIGIGIDANCDVSVETSTTSLRRELGRNVSLIELSQGVLKEMDALYGDFINGSHSFLKEYKEFSHTIGKVVKIVRSRDVLVGRAVDIDFDGGLVLHMEDGAYEKIFFGDCIYLR